MSALIPLSCSNCKAEGVRLDLDVKATPPELVCVKCLKKSKCDRCGKRTHSKVLQRPEPDGTYFQGWKSLCPRCDR